MWMRRKSEKVGETRKKTQEKMIRPHLDQIWSGLIYSDQNRSDHIFSRVIEPHIQSDLIKMNSIESGFIRPDFFLPGDEENAEKPVKT